ncbi:MAG: hypothetical protein ACM3ZQ_08470, partial [Bacillota bacterium]
MTDFLRFIRDLGFATYRRFSFIMPTYKGSDTAEAGRSWMRHAAMVAWGLWPVVCGLTQSLLQLPFHPDSQVVDGNILAGHGSGN